MKKNKLNLLLCTFLYCSPLYSIHSDEMVPTSTNKIKFSKKRTKSHIEAQPGWYSCNNKIKIRYTEVKEIGLFEGGKLYGYIVPSLSNKQWQGALEKGFAKAAKGTNGVKFLNSLLELKIKGDTRLYTQEVHKNDQGDYIAIFNRQGHHQKIKKMANKSALRIHTDCFLRPSGNKR